MSQRLQSSELDEILALQLTVAWAGESGGDRLGWWNSDLVDPEGGGDLFSRLVPKTAAWASLILVREAARVIEHEARKAGSRSDTNSENNLRALVRFLSEEAFGELRPELIPENERKEG